MGTSNIRYLIKASGVVGVADFRFLYTWRTWLVGWLLRVIFQVLFFAMLGRYIGRPAVVAFLVSGGAVAVAVLETMTIVIFTAFDRMFGMLPLLVSAPADYFIVVLARNVFNCIITGTCTSTIALFTCASVMRVPVRYPAALLAIPLIALGAASTYLFGVFLSALIAKVRTGRWVAFNLGYLGLTALCGFLIPVGFWPRPLPALAQLLPFTHALRAIRGLVLGGLPATTIAGELGLELIVAIGWFVLAGAAFRASIERARRDGSIDLVSA
jgi:ABC-2 type transport system permease protein